MPCEVVSARCVIKISRPVRVCALQGWAGTCLSVGGGVGDRLLWGSAGAVWWRGGGDEVGGEVWGAGRAGSGGKEE